VVERLAGLHRKVEATLSSPAGQEALAKLARLARLPADPAAESVLSEELAKQLASDPALSVELRRLVGGIRAASTRAGLQTSAQVGEGHVNVQISGSGNQVGGMVKAP